MRKLRSSPSFDKSYMKYTRNNESLKEKVEETLRKLERDAFEPALKTHKLSGKLRAF